MGLQIDVRWLDLTAHIARREQPVFIARKGEPGRDRKTYGFTAAEVAHAGKFWVPQGPVNGSAPDWSVTIIGKEVRVPLHGYDTAYRSQSGILACGIEIGLAALEGLRHHVADPPESITLVLGHQCTDLAPADDAYRCYVGIAVKVR